MTKNAKRGDETAAGSLLSATYRRLFTPGFFTICLQSQMKKYRCLWYKSTTNHYILYFVCVPRIRLLNSGNCLWKAQNTVAQRGLHPPILPSIRCHARVAGAYRCTNKASPRRGRVQDAEMVQIGTKDVEKWTTGPWFSWALVLRPACQQPAGGRALTEKLAEKSRPDRHCPKCVLTGIICWCRTRTISSSSDWAR